MSQNLFKKAPWINNTNIYEVNVRQYSTEGSFAAFAKELPRLRAMGVETLWFMPITPISKLHMKGTMGSYYACSDYTAINPEFGDLADFKNLVNLAHVLGFKLIIDWVANHTGWDHVWTKTHPEYYLRDEATGTFKMASGMDDIIELDYNNPELRKAMISAMEYWVTECDIDGFRADLASWVRLDFWKEARYELEKTKVMFWLAEADVVNDKPYMEVFDSAYAWTWMHATEAYYKEHKNISVLTDLLRGYAAVSQSENMPLWFTSNHDENSWNGTEFEKYGDMVPALTVFDFTWNGIPLIYSGQEMPNLRRLKFFDKDNIGWDGKYELQEFYSTLAALHKNNPALRGADDDVSTYLVAEGNNAGSICYVRRNGKSEVLVLLNLSADIISVDAAHEQVAGVFRNVFTKEEQDFSADSTVGLAAWGYAVYEKK